MSRARFLLSVFAALYIGAIVGLTFVPTTPETQSSWLLPLGVFFVLGVVLLVLMGPRRWWAAIGFGVLGSAWIEAAQTIWMPVGYSSLDHVFWATIGLVLGVVVALLVTASARKVAPSHVPPSIVPQSGRREIP